MSHFSGLVVLTVYVNQYFSSEPKTGMYHEDFFVVVVDIKFCMEKNHLTKLASQNFRNYALLNCIYK